MLQQVHDKNEWNAEITDLQSPGKNFAELGRDWPAKVVIFVFTWYH